MPKTSNPLLKKRYYRIQAVPSDSTVMTFYNGVATTLPTIGAAQDIANPADSNSIGPSNMKATDGTLDSSRWQK